ncbi:MAG: alpha/beta fold hydrolase [Ilumatobacteraceae bacterium]
MPVPESDLTPDELVARRFPGAVLPERSYRVDVAGIGIAVHEWGDPGAPVLFLLHGGFDFALTFSAFAPLLAAGGWRVVGWDQRGHGDSDHALLYGWDADIRDAIAVITTVTDRPAAMLGHSKGGSIGLQIVNAAPHLITRFVNLDGVPSRRPMPDVADHERTRMAATEVSQWLDHRRKISGHPQRRPGSLDELAERRRRMNPRLGLDWLRFLVTTGAHKSEDGWRWNVDSSLRMGGFGPWRPDWSVQYLAAVPIPFLGVLVGQAEPMGWETTLDSLRGVTRDEAGSS